MMERNRLDRRRFIKEATATAGILLLSGLPENTKAATEVVSDPQLMRKTGLARPKIRFSVIGINHGHINSQVTMMIRKGGEFVSFYAKEPDLAAAFSRKFPQAKQALTENEVLGDSSTQLILSAAIPDERAGIGIRAMQHGKDYMTDKPGMTTLKQLAEVRKVQKETGRIYSILYGDRLENRATVKAEGLVKEGAIGKVIQTIGLGPHRMNPETRPEWFFDRRRQGGIITDLGSHQFDQYLFFTGSTKAEVVASQTGNLNHPQYPGIEDFGDVMLSGNGGTGYLRVDWFTPKGLSVFGDGRLTILGTDGYIEIRKTIDIAGRPGGNHLLLVNNKEIRYFDCSKVEPPYGGRLVDDIVNRTETAMSQEHCFLAAELALKAQKHARNITLRNS